MTARTKSILKSGIFAIAVGALVFFTNPQGSGDLFRRICDAFFTPGALLLGSAGLTWCRNQGAFDLLTYGVTSVFHTHVPGASIGHARDEKEDFLTYRDRKAASRKPPFGTLWVGLVLTALSVVLVVIYELV